MTNLSPTTDVTANADAQAASGEQLQLVTFALGNEEYGIDIMAVREIKVWTETTPLPNSPEFVRGVINLRGVIIPIFDLRDRFGQGKTQTTKTHVVIIIAVEERIVGILVDAVSDILTINTSEICPVPDTEAKQNAFLSGLITVNDNMIALIAPEQLFSRESIQAVENVSDAVAPALLESPDEASE